MTWPLKEQSNAICNSMDLNKCIVGGALIRSGTWIQYLTAPKKA